MQLVFSLPFNVSILITSVVFLINYGVLFDCTPQNYAPVNLLYQSYKHQQSRILLIIVSCVSLCALVLYPLCSFRRYIEERSFRRFVEACIEETIVVYVDHLLSQVCRTTLGAI